MYKPFLEIPPKTKTKKIKKSQKRNNPSTMKHICYLFNNETIFLGFSILTKNCTWKPKSDQREKEFEDRELTSPRWVDAWVTWRGSSAVVRWWRGLVGLRSGSCGLARSGSCGLMAGSVVGSLAFGLMRRWGGVRWMVCSVRRLNMQG